MTPQLRHFFRVNFLWWIMRAHFKMCYMVTKFPKKMLRKTGIPIRIERLIQEFL
jgi:hypothetical protein